MDREREVRKKRQSTHALTTELSAIAAHSILEIVIGMSYEEVTFGMTGLSTPILVHCTDPPP